MKRILLFAFVLLGINLFRGTETFAAASCSSVTVNPTSGTTGTVFRLTATGCKPSIGYNAYITNSAGVRIEIPLLSGGLLVNSDTLGNWSVDLGIYPQENYTITFYEINAPIAITEVPFAVTGGPPPPSSLMCGQLVPAGSQSTCPTVPKCSMVAVPPGSPVGGNWCGCGEYDFGCCPSNNALGRTQCGNGLMPVTESGVCTCKLDTETSKAKYSCGEMIFPSDESNYACLGCEPQILPEQGPANETYWCECGGEGQFCCPTTGAEVDQLDCASGGDDDCNLRPNLKTCNDPRLACSGNICSVSTNIHEALCSDNRSVKTAIGCIPIDTLDRFSAFFITWGLGIGGGIAVMIFIASSFMIATSGGNLQKLETGKELLTAAIAGIVFLVFSMFILQTIGINVLGLF